jgi:competence protein ComEC
VAGLEGALIYVPTPGVLVLPVMVLGALWMVLWQGRARVRLAGLAPFVLAFVIWAGVERPEVLVSGSGGLVGVLTGGGRALSKGRGDGFSARSWLENDGDGVVQAQAFERAGFGGVKGTLEFDVADQTVVHLSGRGAGGRIGEACGRAQVVIVTVKAEAGAFGCEVFDPVRLRATGALAFFAEDDGLKIIEARAVSGQRLWNSRAARR